MKKILFILLAFVAFNSQAQNPLVGKPSLKLVYEVAQTNKWEFTVGATNTLTINGTGGTPAIRLSDFAGTGNRILAVDANGDLVRTSIDPALTSVPGGSTTQVQYNNAGAFGGSSTFVFDGSGNVDITGSLDVDQIGLNGTTITGTGSLSFTTTSSGDINLSPDGSGDIVVPSATRFYVGTGKAGLELTNNSIGNASGGNFITFPSGTLSDIQIDPDGANVDITEGNLRFAGVDRITSAGASTFTNSSLTNTTNQIELGTTNTTIINSTAPAADRIYTIPDFGSDDTFTGIAATQTLTNKTLTSPVVSNLVGSNASTNYEQKLVKQVNVTDNVATDVLALTLPSGSNMAGSYIVEITALISDVTGTTGSAGEASSKFYKGYINYSQGATANGGTIIEVETVESTSSASTAATKDIGACSFTTTKSGTNNSVHTVSFTINSTGSGSSNLRVVFSFEIIGRGFTSFSAN